MQFDKFLNVFYFLWVFSLAGHVIGETIFKELTK